MSRQKKTMLSLLLTVVSLISLIGASFAWMTMSASPTVSDMNLYLISDNNSAFLLAPDEGGKPGQYGLILDMQAKAEKDSLLQPVSFSGKQLAFLLPEYGLDGRIAYLSPVTLSQTPYDSQSVSTGVPGAADPGAPAGHIYRSDFWMKADATPCTVSLTHSYVNSNGVPVQGCYAIGEPIWDEKGYIHRDDGKGAECAIRIGLWFWGTEENPDDTLFVIYEPNADGASAAGKTAFFTGSPDDPAMDLAAGNEKVKLIQQYSSSWSEAETISKNDFRITTGDFITQDRDLITVYPGEERKVSLYVWLEGQDTDCTNTISGGRILANIQFAARASEDLPIHPE